MLTNSSVDESAIDVLDNDFTSVLHYSVSLSDDSPQQVSISIVSVFCHIAVDPVWVLWW